VFETLASLNSPLFPEFGFIRQTGRRELAVFLNRVLALAFGCNWTEGEKVLVGFHLTCGTGLELENSGTVFAIGFNGLLNPKRHNGGRKCFVGRENAAPVTA
jgi:hypothetical protein